MTTLGGAEVVVEDGATEEILLVVVVTAVLEVEVPVVVEVEESVELLDDDAIDVELELVVSVLLLDDSVVEDEVLLVTKLVENVLGVEVEELVVLPPIGPTPLLLVADEALELSVVVDDVEELLLLVVELEVEPPTGPPPFPPLVVDDVATDEVLGAEVELVEELELPVLEVVERPIGPPLDDELVVCKEVEVGVKLEDFVG